MKFGIVSYLVKENTKKIVERIEKTVTEYGGEIIYESRLAEALGLSGTPLENMRTDFVITLGGDGTVLYTLQRCNSKIIAVHLGGLGFLTELNVEEIEERIKNIFEGKYIIDRRIKLKVEVNGRRLYDCINECVIHTDEIAKMRNFRIFLNEEMIDDINADGVIVATPTGSTSYALSTGGPILHPSIDGFVITHIAPFRLAYRSHVVPSNSKIRIEILKNKSCILVMDGQESVKVKSDDIITLSKSEKYAEFVRFSAEFYKKIREKLYYGKMEDKK